MLDAFTSLRLSLTRRIETLEGRVPDVLHGVVEAANPLSVRLADGSLVTNVSSLDPSLEVTNRVRLLAYGGFLTGRRLLVIGRADAPYQGRIPAGSNLNNYATPGQWYNPLNVEVAGFTNGPPSGSAGTLVVMRATGEPGGEAGVTQYWHGYSHSTPHSYVYRRRLYAGSWSTWAKVNDGVEWSKPRRMNMNDTLGIPTAQDFRTYYWSGAWNDGGDSGGIYYSNGGFEISQTGVYTISISARWTTTFPQVAELKLYQGADINNMLEREVIESVNQQSMHGSWTIPMDKATSGRVEVRLRQISGTTRNIGVYPNSNWYQIARVG